MEQKIKGKCRYCGAEYAIGYMGRHLKSCRMRQSKLSSEKGAKKCGYFLLKIYAKYDRDYWMFIEISENATLMNLDDFLRDIWLECCGHLSAFEIDDISYEVAPYDDGFYGEPAEDMNHKLKTVLRTGMTFDYDYDFGSTTELKISVEGYRIGTQKKEKLTILSRNNPPVIMCSKCGQKPAAAVHAEYMWDGDGFFCEDCIKTLDDDEQEFLLNVCNSPRMGVCAYEGSDIYPDQFVPDVETSASKKS